MGIKLNEQIIKDSFPTCFIKVAAQEKYLKVFLEGKLYMRPSGYFRKVENNYRGDPYDGRIHFDTELYHIVIENPITRERFFFDKNHGVDITYSSLGFDGDDLVPIFCLFKLDSSVMQIIDDTTFRIEPHYIQELTQFGDYFTVVNSRELLVRILEYNKSHYDSQIVWGDVNYMSKSEQKSLKSVDHIINNPYQSLFKKRDDYRYQNEWRLILTSSKPRLRNIDEHIYVEIQELPPQRILPIDVLKTMIFRFEEKVYPES